MVIWRVAVVKYRRKKIYSEDPPTIEDDSAEKEREEFKNRLDFLLSNPYRELYLVPHEPQKVAFQTPSDIEMKQSDYPLKVSSAAGSSPGDLKEWTSPSSDRVSIPFEFTNKLDFVLKQTGGISKDNRLTPIKATNLPVPSPASPAIPSPPPAANESLPKAVVPSPASVDEVRYLEHGVIFVKPHAANEVVIALIETILNDHNIHTQNTIQLSGKDLSSRNVVQNQYQTLFRHAILVDPLELPVDEDIMAAFRSHFLAEWSTALNRSQLTNASDAAEYLEITQADLHEICLRSKFPTLRLRRGVHVTFVDETCSNDPAVKSLLRTPLYIINGFYYALKASYEEPDTVVYCILIEWDGAQWTWEDMARRFIGHEDPSQADPSSLRGMIYNNWQRLNLKSKPSRVHNCVHFSQSAFEGMADRLTWVEGSSAHTDIFGSRLLAARVPHHFCQKWMRNPIVDGQSVFDHMLFMNARACLHQAKLLQGESCSIIEFWYF